MFQMKHTPTRKLADALFRGQVTDHFFKVYPLTAAITDQPAVFMIARRILDRRGRGHQLAICIGETESTLKELKKHKRAACAKENALNVVCLLKEKDAKMRRTVIEDLLANRSFSCIRNVYKPKIAPKASRTAKPVARSVRTSAKRSTNAKTGTRVSRGVDSNRGQRGLSNAKRAAPAKAKGRTARVTQPRKKTAA